MITRMIWCGNARGYECCGLLLLNGRSQARI